MTIINHPIYVLSILCLMVIVSVHAGKTRIGKKFGAALLVILFTAVIANLNLIPSASQGVPIYAGVFKYVAPISIFYLLLNVNLATIKRAGLPMIGLFVLGSLATALGFIISWLVISPQNILGADAEVLAGMFTGTYTGGSANFNAIAIEYNMQEQGVLYAGTIAVDNVVTTLWIIFTLALPAIIRPLWKDKKVIIKEEDNHSLKPPEDEAITLFSLMWLLFLGVSAYFTSELISDFIPQIPSILTLTTLGILLAQTKFVANLKGSHSLGLYLVFIFLAVIGAYCEISSVVELKEIGFTLLLFAGLGVLMHGLITILIGGLIYRDWEMIAIISQANVGGGATAIALAETFRRNELILPAILVGSLGTGLGTYLGFLVIYIL
jgi:uncharacterized membrane protein